MNVLIHACPKRMPYVENFLVPSLRAQGIEPEIWNDKTGDGNLVSCMNSFAARTGDGGTWHIQDDVIVCRDFAERCKALERGKVVYGFCNEQFTDDPLQSGEVHLPSAWHSFQCIYIPDAYARECADWFETEAKHDNSIAWMVATGKMDDSLFTIFMDRRHPYDTVINAKPCLVDHVDYLIGGSILSQWRGYLTRAYFWEDEDLVEELKEALKSNHSP